MLTCSETQNLQRRSKRALFGLCIAGLLLGPLGYGSCAPAGSARGENSTADASTPQPKSSEPPEKRPLDTRYLPTVDLAWGSLDLPARVELKVMWREKLILAHQEKAQFTLWTTDQKPRRDQDVRLKKLLTRPGVLLDLATRNDQLLMLYRSQGSVVLLRGTAAGEQLEWVAIKTYQKSDENAPIRMQKLGAELLLFGDDDLLRLDWDTNQVIEVPKALAGRLEDIRCEGKQCVALFEGIALPMRLTDKYEWEKLSIDGSAVPSKDAPRSIALQGRGLLFRAGGEVFQSCAPNAKPLRKVATLLKDGVKQIVWLHSALAGLEATRVRLTHGDKPARLELPGYLEARDKSSFTLTRLQSLGGYILLENDEKPKSYRRYSLAYQPNLVVDDACD